LTQTPAITPATGRDRSSANAVAGRNTLDGGPRSEKNGYNLIAKLGTTGIWKTKNASATYVQGIRAKAILEQPHESKNGRQHSIKQRVHNDTARGLPAHSSTSLRKRLGGVRSSITLLDEFVPLRDGLRGEIIRRGRGIRPAVDFWSFRESVDRVLRVLASRGGDTRVRYETRLVVPQDKLAKEGPCLQNSERE
jgi:hypothetical protein